MTTLMTALLPMVASWGFMALLFGGLGLLVTRCMKRPPALSADQLVLVPWLGWAAAVAVLQVLHCCMPVQWGALALLFVLSSTGFILARKEITQFWVAHRRAMVISLAGSFPVMLWVASHCASQPGVYDCGLYHLSAIRWATEYPLIPGLALLHGRLGFNNSSALYAALLDQGWFQHKSHQLAGGFLALLLFARGAWAVVRWRTAERPAMREIFYALTPLPVAIWIVNAGEVSSPTPDTMVFLLGFVIGGELLRLMCPETSPGANGWRHRTTLHLALLCAAGVSCKMNFAVPAGVAVVLALLSVFRDPAHRTGSVRLCAWAAGIAALVLIPWAARGVVLSGYPAYPALAGGMVVEWKVPAASVKCEADWIKAWARDPGRPKEEVLGTWNWVGRWFARQTRIHKADVLTPLVIGLAGCMLALRGNGERRYRDLGLFLLCPLSAIVFVLLTAPDPRFAGAAFWIIGLAGLSWFLASLPRSIGWRIAAVMAALLLAREITAVEFAGPWRRDAGPARTVSMKTMTTDSGLKLFVPESGDQCWNATLPCTPYFSPALRLRNPASLASGFTIAPAVSGTSNR